MDFHAASLVVNGYSFSRFGFIARTVRQTESHTHTQTRMIAILTRLPSTSVNRNLVILIVDSDVSRIITITILC